MLEEFEVAWEGRRSQGMLLRVEACVLGSCAVQQYYGTQLTYFSGKETALYSLRVPLLLTSGIM